MGWMAENWDLVVFVVVFLIDKFLSNEAWRSRVRVLVSALNSAMNSGELKTRVQSEGLKGDVVIDGELDKIEPKDAKRVSTPETVTRALTQAIPVVGAVKDIATRFWKLR